MKMFLVRPGKRRRRGEDGQSLIETALGIPMLLTLAFNAVNLGYFWFMVLTLAAIPRHGVEYSTQGGQASALNTTPTADQVKTMTYENLTGALKATVTNASVQVCSQSVGTSGTGSSKIASCTSYGPSYTYSTVTADPEAPYFILHRVTVVYTVTPLIQGTLFNVLLPSNLQFKRSVLMRNLY